MNATRRSPGTRVLVFSVALAVGGALVFWWRLAGEGPVEYAGFRVGPLPLILLFVAAEIMMVHFAVRGEVYTVSLADVPLVIGLALASPGTLVAGRLVGGGLTLLIIQRLPWRKVAFNVAMFVPETVLAILAYRWFLDGAEVVSLRGIMSALAAALLAGVFGTMCVTVVMRLATGTSNLGAMVRVLSTVLITTTVNTAVGVGVVAALVYDAWLAMPTAVGAVLLYLLYRGYGTLSQRYDELEALHLFTERVTSSLDLDITTKAILASARQLLRCEQAWLLTPGGVRGPRMVRFEGDEVTERRLPGSQATELVALLVPDATARVVDPAELPIWFGGHYKDIVAAPISFDSDSAGALVAANRLTTVSTFDAKDVPLLETLANQAGVALQNGRLFDQLKSEAERRTHQALHDDLTGLPNRTQLDEQFGNALGAARLTGSKVGVLVIDLEGFKDVNDTLGHQTGDEVLRHVCRRMSAHLPTGALLARFGGDEFVVLLPAIADETDATSVGVHMLEALSAPFRFQDLTLAVGARVGVALYPDHGSDPSTLLQRADVAMYRAKVMPSGVAVYAPEDDPFTPQRLALAGELREAIGRGEIEVLFQPKVSLKTNAVVGAEALVRWRHPQRGLLPANTFVPVAERTGMIHPLTLHVLSVALSECRKWRDAGYDLSVAVNLSMQNLLDTRLPGDLVDFLVEKGLPPNALVLELTESLAMTEVRRTLGVLSQVHELGIRLAIDDFGTGYSSLAYLRRLPVSELKIDRSFVHSLAIDDPGAAIVATVIELGHQLGLEVVAEGIESMEALERLATMGCDIGQGYVISPPRTADSFGEWLVHRQSALA